MFERASVTMNLDFGLTSDFVFFLHRKDSADQLDGRFDQKDDEEKRKKKTFGYWAEFLREVSNCISVVEIKTSKMFDEFFFQ